MSKVTLQVPMDIKVRDQATKIAHAIGFSSLQEYLRVSVHKMIRETPKHLYDESEERLSPKAERRYDKMYEDVIRGKEKVYVAKNVDDLLDHLYGRKPHVLKTLSEIV